LECYGWEADLDQFDWGSLVLVPAGQSGFGGCDAWVNDDYTIDLLGSVLLVKLVKDGLVAGGVVFGCE
jgi:hypothetical protein